jgi:hypothetical protein
MSRGAKQKQGLTRNYKPFFICKNSDFQPDFQPFQGKKISGKVG